MTGTPTAGAGLTGLDLPDETAQLAFGAALAGALAARPPGRCGLVTLSGDLGAGKTTLVRGLLRGLGHVGPVRSPTFTLLEPYEHLTPPVYHLDLYRVGDAEELEYLGLADLLTGDALLLVEWPERGAGVLPAADLAIRIAHAGSGRRLDLTATPAWAGVVQALGAG